MAGENTYRWDDPFLFDDQLAEDERLVRDTARDYAQGKLMPRILEANRNEHFDPEIMTEMGALGLLGSTIPEEYGGAGVNHTLSGIAYKTFNNSLAELRAGTLRTLEDMDMTVIADSETEDGWEIKATAIEREIDIELERLTKRATRMRVVANDGEIFFKDAATATEIIIMTAENVAPAG